jgi:ribosomal protein S18 acetylase RimI-like enzyme
MGKMTASLLARFDEEMRRDPPRVPGKSIERCEGIVRCLGSYNTILFWQLGADEVDRGVAEQTDYFRRRGEAVEWKVYGHDGPPNLTVALAAHGFEPEEPETFMIFDLVTAAADLAAPEDVAVRRVRTPGDLDVYVDVSSRAFGSGPKAGTESLARRLFEPDGDMFAFLASVDGIAAAGGRLELPPDRAFASMWGGGTDPAFRRRGLFRALVAERAALARSRGYSFLSVDAKETSRPILERLGFIAMTSVTAWILPPAKV